MYFNSNLYNSSCIFLINSISFQSCCAVWFQTASCFLHFLCKDWPNDYFLSLRRNESELVPFSSSLLFQKLRYFTLTYLKSFHKKAKLLELICWSLYDILLVCKNNVYSAEYETFSNVRCLEINVISTPSPSLR